MIVVCFLLFFHTLFSCSAPSRVRIEKGLFEGLPLLILCKVVTEKCHFETFPHFLLKKLTGTKKQEISIRIDNFCDLVLVTSPPRTLPSRQPHRLGCGACTVKLLYIQRVHGKLLCMQHLLDYVSGSLRRSSHGLSGLSLS